MSDRVASKVLLIGWDAADWTMIRPLLGKGWMPNLQRIMAGGVWGNLATIRPVLSPMLWNSIATGKRADKHGICGFVEPKPDSTGVRPVRSTSRKCKAVWNILSQNDISSNVICWYASYPAEPIRGAVVTDRYLPHFTGPPEKAAALNGELHPSELRGELDPLRVDVKDLDHTALLPFVPNAAGIDQKKDDRLLRLGMMLAMTSTVHASACWLMSRRPADFTAVYYSAIDQFGHIFMPYHPPRIEGVSEADFEMYKDVMIGIYRFHDMMLGALLHQAGEETTVLLVSDHGFHHAQKRPGHDATQDPESWHTPFGVVCASGPGIKRGERLFGATLLDVTPTILTMFGLPVGGDSDGRPWLELFDRPVQAERIISWERVSGEDGMHTDDLREDPATEAEAIRHLVELGYVDAPDEDARKTVERTLLEQKRNLAVALTDSYRCANAIPIWRELIQQRPKDYLLKVHLARAMMRAGRIADGIEVLDQIDGKESHRPVNQLLLGEAKLALGQPEAAFTHLRSAEQHAPMDPGIRVALGSAYLKTEQWALAEKQFTSALEVDESCPPAHCGLAQTAIRAGKFDEALGHALLAVDMMHNYPDAHYYLGVALVGLDMIEQSALAFETCLAQEPGHSGAHEQLARVLARIDKDHSRSWYHDIAMRSANARQ